MELSKLPKKIGHSYIPVKDMGLEFLDTPYAKQHRRLMVFHYKGLKCANPECDKVGAYVIQAKEKRSGNLHIDVYTKEFDLMTVDHIIPRALEGGEELENKQPMCQKCNEKKGAILPEEAKERYAEYQKNKAESVHAFGELQSE